MLIDVKIPVLAESVVEATLLEWHKKAGDVVKRDDKLVELETDKVVLEITAPQDGVLKQIRKGNGSTVVSGETIAMIDSDAGSVAASPVVAAPAPEKSNAPGVKTAAAAGATKLSPAVRKIVEEKKLDPGVIAGSGKDGRILKEDIQRHLDIPAATADLAKAIATDERTEKRVPMTRLRSRIAERLLESQRTTATLTTFNEVNMQPVMDIRQRYQEKFQREYEIKLGFMSFFIKAAVEALKKYPIINASVDGNDIIYHGFFDIGVAVSTDRGLVVPILRDVDQMSFAQIETGVAGYVEKARSGKLAIEELTGGTFTITNGGIFGSLLSTPILNPPQSAILGMHKIQERAVVENGAIVARPIMYLALSYDHRIIDGRDAVLFLVAIKDELEDPARMLLGI
ncbi:MAG: 2-oxoglutarate dehydrogenase E2 component (dihydrolipoamide succinyltransferase) [Gammaproteobacteria bacterium]|nr:MAG: 2-oxoglutarate dehydrogenase E2 component (dihydrolipoamide succinyltransferase) [Gammaproteobacteria bacterium]TND06822.1 MAG: 2-oxoglutarate dehydrogenase E2 component (dihydrolipoamide succinyltransferase) [Gammaproteobacteria bacterium]